VVSSKKTFREPSRTPAVGRRDNVAAGTLSSTRSGGGTDSAQAATGSGASSNANTAIVDAHAHILAVALTLGIAPTRKPISPADFRRSPTIVDKLFVIAAYRATVQNEPH
jgi:hypothetical protein